MKRNRTQVTAEPAKQEIIVTREFEAPRELVFRAHTDPRLFARWFGCENMTTTVLEFEARAGGRYRFKQTIHGQPGEFAANGVFHEVRPSERIVKTFEFEGYPGHVVLESARFEDLPGGRTRLTSQQVFQSVADRDGMLKAGVEKGTGEAFERMDELLERLKTT